MSGQVLVHPSHICQIGESDQGRFAVRQNQSVRKLVPGFPLQCDRACEGAEIHAGEI